MSSVSVKRQENDTVWWQLIEVGRGAARRLGLSLEDAEDCAVEFALKTMERPERVLRDDLPPSQAEAWLRRCARNWGLNFMRRLRTRLHESLDAPEMSGRSTPGQAQDPCFRHAQRQEFSRFLQAELYRLPKRQQDLFSRCCLGGDSVSELTQSGSGQTAQQTYLTLHRARKSLRGRLEGRGITAESLFAEN